MTPFIQQQVVFTFYGVLRDPIKRIDVEDWARVFKCYTHSVIGVFPVGNNFSISALWKNPDEKCNRKSEKQDKEGTIQEGFKLLRGGISFIVLI